jgi:hypothetical protein
MCITALKIPKKFFKYFYYKDPTPFTQHLAKPPERAGGCKQFVKWVTGDEMAS